MFPNDDKLRREIFKVENTSSYAMHQGATKIYETIKYKYWQNIMKKDNKELISKTLVCKNLKA